MKRRWIAAINLKIDLHDFRYFSEKTLLTVITLKLENEHLEFVPVPVSKSVCVQKYVMTKAWPTLIKAGILQRFGFTKCHLAEPCGMFNTTLFLSSSSARDRSLETLPAFIKSVWKVAHEKNKVRHNNIHISLDGLLGLPHLAALISLGRIPLKETKASLTAVSIQPAKQAKDI